MRGFAKVVIIAVIEFISLCPAVFTVHAQDAAPIIAKDIHDCFIYSDLVVEGVIEKISKVTVPMEDYLPGLIGPDIPMVIMDFRIDTVLVGYETARHIEIVANNFTS